MQLTGPKKALHHWKACKLAPVRVCVEVARLDRERNDRAAAAAITDGLRGPSL